MSFKCIDTHMHMGASPSYVTRDVSVESLLQKMDGLEIEYGISSHMLGLQNVFEEGAERDVAYHRQSGGRIFAYFVFNPLYAQTALEVIQKYQGHPVFKGIKIHPSGCNVDADDERWRPVWETAKALRLPILSHTWNISQYNPNQKSAFAGKFEKYVAEYPTVDFIFAHSGGRWDGIIAAMKIGMQYRHTYFDIAGDILGNGVVETLVGHVGADRILWGSDCYMIEQRPMLGVVLGSNLKTSDKEKILRYNAEKLFFSDK